MSWPSVSVLVLNYNGAHFLRDCLPALERQDYPRNLYRVIVVDNASSDSSAELVRQSFPWAGWHQNPHNWGFARGYNAAIQATSEPYLVLLNNDTVVEPGWLRALVQAAEAAPRVGLCGSKIVLRFRQINVSLCVSAPHGARAQIFGVEAGNPYGVIQYLDGWSRWEGEGEGCFRWIEHHALLGLPVVAEGADLIVRLRLAASSSAAVQASVNGRSLAEWQVEPQPRWITLTVPLADLSDAVNVIQSAGSRVYTHGAGRDRGTHMHNGEPFYEGDHGQYHRAEEVFAACGGSLLIRRAMLDDVGLLDDDFFMYYEDIDLCWRARLQGWHVLYVPTSVVRHVHYGTSKEGSERFLFYTFRNRLAMLFKNATWSAVMQGWMRFGGWTLWETVRWPILAIRGNPEAHARMRCWRAQVRTCFALLSWLPRLIVQRARIQRRRTVPQHEIKRWLIPLHRETGS